MKASSSPTYALVLRDKEGTYLATASTRKQLRTLHGKITPAFHTFLTSVFQLNQKADTIAIIAFQQGMKVREAVPLLVARRTETPGQLAYSEPEGMAV